MSVKEITPQELYRKFISGQKPTLVDVRNPTSFGEWNIFTSQNVPYSKIMSLDNPNDFPLNGGGPVITVCGKGNDSKVTAQKLLDIGVEAISLKGGIREWNNVMNIVQIPSSSEKVEIYQVQRIAKGCLSYIIIDNDEAIIIDPAFNTDSYLEFLSEKNVTLTKVLETHLHADHVAGGRFLAEKFGVELLLPEHDPFKFDFKPVKSDTILNVGDTKISAVYTPGHTKGSTSYRIGNDVLLVGDTVFVDGLGRPDLADKADEFSKYLYNSLNNVIAHEHDNILLGPAHHGTIGLDHLKKSIDIKKSDLTKYEQLGYNEEEFIKYAVESARKTKKPDSYETIAKINAGLYDLKEFNVMDLETGPNRCALS